MLSTLRPGSGAGPALRSASQTTASTSTPIGNEVDAARSWAGVGTRPADQERDRDSARAVGRHARATSVIGSARVRDLDPGEVVEEPAAAEGGERTDGVHDPLREVRRPLARDHRDRPGVQDRPAAERAGDAHRELELLGGPRSPRPRGSARRRRWLRRVSSNCRTM